MKQVIWIFWHYILFSRLKLLPKKLGNSLLKNTIKKNLPFWGRVLSEIHNFFYPFSGTPTRIMDWMVRPINTSTITCPTSWRGALPEFHQTIEDCLCNLNCALIWEQERKKHKVVPRHKLLSVPVKSCLAYIKMCKLHNIWQSEIIFLVPNVIS